MNPFTSPIRISSNGDNTMSDFDTRADAIAATIPGTVNVLRIAGYAAPGDLGGALYKRVASQPAHNGKIQSADGTWWEIAERVFTVHMFGGAGDDTADNSAALASALGAGGNYPRVYFPAGSYKFSSTVSFTMPNTVSTISLFGDGPDVTILRWPNTGNGIAITAGGNTQGFHFQDLTFSTGVAGGGTGIDINQTSGGTNSSSFTNLVFRGSDGYQAANYWATAANLLRVSNVAFEKVFVSGPVTTAGNGVTFAGTVGAAPGVFNFTDCTFNFLGNGVTYGAYAQGATFKGCNFTNNTNGISVTAGATGQDQLAVSCCQFGINNGGAGISLLGSVRDLNVSGCLFLFDNASAIYYGAGNIASIRGNNFSAGGTVNGIAINVQANDANHMGMIDGNTFFNIGNAILLATGTTDWTVGASNKFKTIGTNVNNQIPANNLVMAPDGVGFATGSGGAVTQATSKATGVSLSRNSGQITLNNAALAAAAAPVSFVLTNTYIAATDVLVLNHVSGGTPGAYTLNAQCAAGSATINVRNNTAGPLSEAIVLQYVLMKGANS
jgi:hypothetical protein